VVLRKTIVEERGQRCIGQDYPSFDSHPLATCPVPIVVPSIQERASEELPRIVDADAFDAIRTLGEA
jgi:hypothetical protein